jgi:hypothetical protein
MRDPLLAVGWNKGEMDFAIRATVFDLSPEQMNDLRRMIVVGIGTLEAMWRTEQERKNPASQQEK